MHRELIRFGLGAGMLVGLGLSGRKQPRSGHCRRVTRARVGVHAGSDVRLPM